MTYEKITKPSIRNHPELNERWVQDRIAEDTAALDQVRLGLVDGGFSAVSHAISSRHERSPGMLQSSLLPVCDHM